MERVVVAVLDRPETAADVLSGAARLLDLVGGGCVQAVFVRVPPAATIMPTEEVLTAKREAEICTAEENQARQLKEIYDEWLPAVRQSGAQAAWIDIEADLDKFLAEQGRQAAAVVVAQAIPHTGARAHEIVHVALFGTGNPVLLVPRHTSSDFGRIVALAWKADDHAPKALISALPILRQAERVPVLSVTEGSKALPEAPSILRERGIQAEIHAISAHGGGTGEKLLAVAHQLGADMLVMGAYGHGEWREALFGGVTRHMLRHADLPVLMQH